MGSIVAFGIAVGSSDDDVLRSNSTSQRIWTFLLSFVVGYIIDENKKNGHEDTSMVSFYLSYDREYWQPNTETSNDKLE